jgi:hypothetical protein
LANLQLTENAGLAVAFHEFMAGAAAARLAYNTALLESRLDGASIANSPGRAHPLGSVRRERLLLEIALAMERERTNHATNARTARDLPRRNGRSHPTSCI